MGHEAFNLMDIAHALSQGGDVSEADFDRKSPEAFAPQEDSIAAEAEDTTHPDSLPGEAAADVNAFCIPEIDPALCEIYRSEAEIHLQTLREYVFNARIMETHDVSPELLRALHTLSGSSRTTGMSPVAELSGTFEKYVKQRDTSDLTLHDTAIDVLEEYVEFVTEAASQVDKPGTELASHQEVLQKIDSLLDQAIADSLAAESPIQADTTTSTESSVPENAVPQEYDDELLENDSGEG